MEKELDELITKYEEGNMTLITLKSELLRLFSVSRCSTKPELVKCRNCDEMVEMVSSGEFCPCCFC